MSRLFSGKLKPMCQHLAAAFGITWAGLLAHADGLPANPSVQAGAVRFDTSDASRLRITQTSGKAIIDWEQFSIARGSSVQFIQPSSAAIALNRVTGTQESRIDGSVLANGQVWLLNPNGVLIGRSGEVQAAGFLATTLGIDERDFTEGRVQHDVRRLASDAR